MQCPGCGFENEIGNKFCNMCGMALPLQGDSSQAPMERAPLDFDLTLEGTGNQELDIQSSDTAQPLPAEPDGLALQLDINDTGISDGDFKLDTDISISEPGSLNIDLNSTPGFDLSEQPAMPEANENPLGDFKISGDDPFALSLDSESSPDLSINSNEPADSFASFDSAVPSEPTKAADSFTFDNSFDSLNSSMSEKTSDDISSEMSLNTSNDISFDAPGDINIAAPESPTGSDDMFSTDNLTDNSADQSFSLDLSLESDSGNTQEVTQTFDMSNSEPDFNFGDLDTASAPAFPQAAKPTLAPIRAQPVVQKQAPAVVVPAAKAEVAPEPRQKQAVAAKPAAQKTAPVAPAPKPQPQPLPQKQFVPEQNIEIVEESLPESQPEEMDEDLAGLFLGIEGKAPVKIIPSQKAPQKPVAQQIETVDFAEPEADDQYAHGLPSEQEDKDHGTEEYSTGFSNLKEEDDTPQMNDLVEDNLENVQEQAPMTPQERLKEIAAKLKSAEDADEKYSLVLTARDLALPEADELFMGLLSDVVKDIREIAAEYLGDTACAKAVQPLLQCLASGEPSLVFITARSLGNIRDESATGPLIKLLEEDNDDLRYVALEALGKIGAPVALKPVATFLKSRNHDLRLISCEAIGNIKDAQAVSLLLPMLKDSDFEVRLKAIEALGKIGSTAACDQLLVVLGEDNERIRLATIHALGQIKNPNAVEALVDIFQLGNPQIKEKIIWALGEISSERAVDPILSLSQGFNSKLIFLAIEAFAKIKSPKSAKFVLAMLDRKDLTLRLKAIEALGEIADKSSAGNLISFLSANEPELKIASAKALGKIGNPLALDPLVTKLVDSERDVRLAAIEALGNIRGVKAIPALINSLREQDPQIIEKTEWALCEMSDLAVEPATKALFSEPPEVLASLVKVLGKIGSVRAIFPLLKVLETSEDKLKTHVADALLAIDKHLTEDNPISVILKQGYAWAQFSIAQALSNMGDERAFPLLIKVAKESLTDKDIKKLAGIPDKRILECSVQILELIKLNVSRLFAQVGNNHAIPVLMQYFSEGDLIQRQWCVEALGGIQTEGALDALIEILKKPEYQVPLELISKQLIASKNRKLVEKLIISASHPNETVRTSIAVVLGETNDPRAIKTLSGLVKDASGKVRTAAIEAIGNIGTTAAVQPAIEALKDSMESVRAKAAHVLGELSDTAAVEFLEKATHDGSEVVRCIAIRALAAMQDQRVSEILTNSLGDTTEEVRAAAVEVLGTRKDRLALPNLIKSLEDASERVREKAAVALGQIADTRAILPMLYRLDDPSSLVPLACSESIVSFKVRSFPVLIEALKAEEERIRRHACDLLIRIGDEELVTRLLKLLNDRNNFLRENVVRILGKIGDGRVVDPLITILADRSSSVRRTAAEALGSLKDIRSIVALKKAERDQSREVRQAAAQSLQDIFKAHKLS
ncbi:MAG: HEAT repeat domain-containing protein [Candidatus Riflebacteria bacterium]|nr:HEAT repeat domain-containing protein [Candidatus Riflebacteria bacterium]